MLTPRQERFVAEYLRDMEATAAYVRAGYARKGASAGAASLMRRADIQAAIAARQKRLAEQFAVTRERVLAELGTVAFTSVDDFFVVPPQGAPRFDMARADRRHFDAVMTLTIDEFQDPKKVGGRLSRTTIRMCPKVHALDSLGRHYAQLTGKDAAPVTRAEDLEAARLRAWGPAGKPQKG